MQDNIMVSVLCITYNQGPYIKDAIEGFLMQKTNFSIEILIGEDCSPDNTREVIEAYQEKYPGRIFMITSNRNVGGAKNMKRIQKLARGKYWAFCEGDDFWISPHKLQKQVDYMEMHPNCSIYRHEGFLLDMNHQKESLEHKRLLCGIPEVNDVYDLNDLLKYVGRGGPMASVMVRPEYMSLPEWTEHFSFGDFFLELFTIVGDAYSHFDPEPMSVYRTNVPTSYNGVRNAKPMPERLLNWMDYELEMLLALHYFNREFNYRWDKEVKEYQRKVMLTNLRMRYRQLEMWEAQMRKKQEQDT